MRATPAPHASTHPPLPSTSHHFVPARPWRHPSAGHLAGVSGGRGGESPSSSRRAQFPGAGIQGRTAAAPNPAGAHWAPAPAAWKLVRTSPRRSTSWTTMGAWCDDDSSPARALVGCARNRMTVPSPRHTPTGRDMDQPCPRTARPTPRPSEALHGLICLANEGKGCPLGPRSFPPPCF